MSGIKKAILDKCSQQIAQPIKIVEGISYENPG